MAKLNPKDPQYGIPIASRVEARVAKYLADKASEIGVSMSRYVAIVLGEAVDNASVDDKLKKDYNGLVEKYNTLFVKNQKTSKKLKKCESDRKEAIAFLIKNMAKSNKEAEHFATIIRNKEY